MDDFLDDDALLAMVGDESEGKDEGADSTSGERERSTSPPLARSPSPEQSPPRQTTETSSKAQPRRGTATKMSSKSSTARRRKANESDDEGEASSTPGSPASLGSDAMDESDSDASPADYLDANDDIPYPLEGKYKNAADKAYVLGLTEVQREQVLAEREEEAAAKRRDKQLKSLLDSKEAEKSRKRKAAADLDDERRPARAKTSREKVLDAYKTQREQAREGGRRRALGRTTRRSRSRSMASSRDASGSPDIDYPAASHQKEADHPVELADIERVRVGRTRLAKVCFFPKFEETMVGCFVRVCIGQDSNRQPEYRMTVIKGVVTGTPYLVDASPAVQPFYTDQYVMLAHGKAQKQWSFMHCSDSRFTDKEFNRWKQQLTVTDGLHLTMKSEADKICTKINALLEHHLTSEEINDKIAKRDKYRHLFVASSTAAPPRTKSDDAAEKLRLRNEKIRKQNTTDVRKALVAEQAKRRAAMKAQMARGRPNVQNTATPPPADAGNSLAVPGSDFDDLFSGGSDISRAASPAVGSPAPAVQNAATSGTNTPQKHKSGRFTKMTMDDDIISGMDLAIDIEI